MAIEQGNDLTPDIEVTLDSVHGTRTIAVTASREVTLSEEVDGRVQIVLSRPARKRRD